MSKGKELRRTVLGSETCQRPEDWRKGRSQEAGRDLEPARLEVGLILAFVGATERLRAVGNDSDGSDFRKAPLVQCVRAEKA